MKTAQYFLTQWRMQLVLDAYITLSSPHTGNRQFLISIGSRGKLYLYNLLYCIPIILTDFFAVFQSCNQNAINEFQVPNTQLASLVLLRPFQVLEIITELRISLFAIILPSYEIFDSGKYCIKEKSPLLLLQWIVRKIVVKVRN